MRHVWKEPHLKSIINQNYQPNYSTRKRKGKGGNSLIILIAWIGSAVISIFIGSCISKYYLSKLNADWLNGLSKLEKTTIHELDVLKKSIGKF